MVTPKKREQEFIKVNKTLKGNKIMTKVEQDGIYIRFAGDEKKGEYFTLDWVKVHSFESRSMTYAYGLSEMIMLSKSCTDKDNRPIVEEFHKPMLELVDAFGHSGQSGGSAPNVAVAICHTLKQLFLHKPICPITGIEQEWDDVSVMSNDGMPSYQNNRCSAIFKDSKDGQAYYLDAIVFKDDRDNTFTTNHPIDGVTSRQYVKSFPFTPKTFYIDVISKDGGKSDTIKNPKQLDRVWKYYKQMRKVK